MLNNLTVDRVEVFEIVIFVLEFLKYLHINLNESGNRK